jgi:CDP-diacylglycerol--glycerol-3-phosphate 3-phosphatidyltransferase
MTTASKVTMVRIFMIPIFMLFMYWEFKYSDLIALTIFAVAGITDSIDGYIARKYNQVSNFGKFIDPLADKLLVMAAILVFIGRGQMPSWAAMIVISREFAVTALRLVAVEGGKIIAAGTSGKIKTVTSIIAICVMITEARKIVIIPDMLTVNGICIFLMVATTLWSGIEYFVVNWQVMTFNA